jgi:hypothetical protein
MLGKRVLSVGLLDPALRAWGFGLATPFVLPDSFAFGHGQTLWIGNQDNFLRAKIEKSSSSRAMEF